MARKPRIHVDGGFYHVMLRGNGGDDIFFSNGDRSRFSLLLQEGTERFKYKVHAFCLMKNHVHLVVQVSDIPLSKIIHNLSFRYTKYINKRKKRSGHIFQGRYKAILVDADSYLLELIRYIHNNPVRIGLIDYAVNYKWSSHKVYLGHKTVPFVTTEWVLEHFGKRLETSRKNFEIFVNKGNDEGYRSDLQVGETDPRILGDDRFVDKVVFSNPVIRSPSLARVIKFVCKNYKVKEKELSGQSRARNFSEIRGIIGWLCVKLNAASLTDIAYRFNRDLATISRAVSRIDRRSLKSPVFANKLGDHVKDLTE